MGKMGKWWSTEWDFGWFWYFFFWQHIFKQTQLRYKTHPLYGEKVTMSGDICRWGWSWGVCPETSSTPIWQGKKMTGFATGFCFVLFSPYLQTNQNYEKPCELVLGWFVSNPFWTTLPMSWHVEYALPFSALSKDKLETAKNIGFSTRVLSRWDVELFH